VGLFNKNTKSLRLVFVCASFIRGFLIEHKMAAVKSRS